MRIKRFLRALANSRLSVLFSFLYQIAEALMCFLYSAVWFLRGARRPSREEQEIIASRVTFIYKSFERQRMAKRLFRSIRSYYPGARVIIADDSRKPLALRGDNLTVLQLPFNSGLSYGLKRALALVETPYVFRLDDDEKLSLRTGAGKQLAFLERHPEVDLVSVLSFRPLGRNRSGKNAAQLFKNDMRAAVKPLTIPHMTEIEPDYCVVGKAPNIYIARTDKLRAVGFDENIRMLDHNDFFYRAAGNIVSVVDLNASVFHMHNPFMPAYAKYRGDFAGDLAYIKRRLAVDALKKKNAARGAAPPDGGNTP